MKEKKQCDHYDDDDVKENKPLLRSIHQMNRTV